ncbi:hypothetical protein [uncultured Acinetobacter sp.]|uniref:hypothetical protein n=1 Tax=uncultured Acinetobacter sp. TaxID=165433 RepID=UPI0025E3B29C|nr:hypothetical protein [uncultured Acinetobacter sp.]
MKKIFVTIILVLSSSQIMAGVSERYVRDIEKISNQYNADMKFFLRSLDPQLNQFTPQQQLQFCGMIQKYVDDMYKTTDENRADLPPSLMSVTKQNIIDKVMVSPEMQILKKYNIQCNLH